MKKTYIILLLTLSLNLFSQDSNTKFMMIFDDCELKDYITVADKAPDFMGGEEELNNYFKNKLRNKPLTSMLEGKIFIQLFIDKYGKVCTRQIANKTGEDISELELQKLINEMPVWQAAEDEGNKVNYSAFLILNFSDGVISVTYNKTIKNKEKKNYNIPYYSIEQALNYIDKAKTLNLSDKGLQELSPDIGKLIFLNELNLSQNNLKKLPEEIWQLKDLKFLYLSGNQLISLPKQINNLKNLEVLMLNKNELKSLPKELGELKKLKMLKVADNKISEKDIERIKKLLPDCHIIN